jgi:DNA invertase Pin-like site-specific DNA recombinase
MDNQVKTVVAFAESEGYTEFDIFCDNGESGITLNRPSFNSLRAEIRNGKIKAVIVKDTARLARDYFLLSEFLEEAKSYGVKVITMYGGEAINEFHGSLNNMLKNWRGVTA